MKNIMKKMLMVFFALCVLALPALAVEPDEMLADPVQEAQALEITRNLRCPSCAGQAVDDSDAPLAGDIRKIVREMVHGGAEPVEIYGFLRSRYGDAVLLNPPLSDRTIVLRLAPYLVLLFGFLFIAGFAWRHNRKGT